MRRAPLALILVLATAGCSPSGPRTVRIEMRQSAFEPSAFSVAAGERVRIVLVNEDPIAHEFVLGDEAEQRRHERSADTSHDGRPGQASLEPGETDVLMFTFPRDPGNLIFGCHRPGHYRYGMRGSARIG